MKKEEIKPGDGVIAFVRARIFLEGSQSSYSTPHRTRWEDKELRRIYDLKFLRA